MKTISKLLAVVALLTSVASAQTQPAGVLLGTFSANSGGTALPTVGKQVPSGFYTGGLLTVSYTGLTGSPVSCIVALYPGGVLFSGTGSALNVNISALSGTGNNVFRVPFVSQPIGPYSTIGTQFSCSTYWTSGTFTLEFIPDAPQVSASTWTYTHITSNASTVVKNFGGAQLHTVVIGSPGSAETLTIFDNTACSGTVISVITPTAGATYIFDTTAITGLCITTAGTTAGDYTVTSR